VVESKTRHRLHRLMLARPHAADRQRGGAQPHNDAAAEPRADDGSIVGQPPTSGDRQRPRCRKVLRGCEMINCRDTRSSAAAISRSQPTRRSKSRSPATRTRRTQGATRFSSTATSSPCAAPRASASATAWSVRHPTPSSPNASAARPSAWLGRRPLVSLPTPATSVSRSEANELIERSSDWIRSTAKSRAETSGRRLGPVGRGQQWAIELPRSRRSRTLPSMRRHYP
jgi:hypothetical protein